MSVRAQPKKAAFKLDLAANIAGVGWSFLTQIICIPIYLKFLGIEAYGLIGFYLMLQAILQVLDFGLSPTMNREMARYSVQPEKADEARDLVRTLEAGYWAIGILIGAALLFTAHLISTHWIEAGTIPAHEVERTVILMGVLAVFQWPATFYQGGLLGLGRQVQFNGLNIVMSSLANGGAVFVLWRISRTIQSFFLWLVVVNVAKAILLAIFLWRNLPTGSRAPQINLPLLRGIWRFAAGMSGITACALFLTQSDKLILSKLISLKMFGYYALSGMFGTGLAAIVGSVFNTIFNRFSSLVATGDDEALKRLYHRSTQLMAVVIFPVAAVLAAFSGDILQLWTKNPDVARVAGPIASILVVGSAINGITYLPYALQLAYGWTSITLRINIFLTITSVPAIWIMALRYGTIGAASIWPILNCVYLMIAVPITHRRFLSGEASLWLTEDLGYSLIAALLVVGLGRALVNGPMSPGVAFISISVIFLCAQLAAVLAAPQIRSRFLAELSKILVAYA